MVALAYGGALRREESVQIEFDDLEPVYSLIHLPAETTKSKRAPRWAPPGKSAPLVLSSVKARRWLSATAS